MSQFRVHCIQGLTRDSCQIKGNKGTWGRRRRHSPFYASRANPLSQRALVESPRASHRSDYLLDAPPSRGPEDAPRVILNLTGSFLNIRIALRDAAWPRHGEPLFGPKPGILQARLESSLQPRYKKATALLSSYRARSRNCSQLMVAGHQTSPKFVDCEDCHSPLI